MASTEILASACSVAIKDTTYKDIGGLDSIVLSSAAVKADTGNIDHAGVGSHLIAERTKSIVLKGKYLVDASDGSRDAGQAAVEALARLTGATSVGTWKFTGGDGVARYATGTATMGDLMGGYTSAAEWAVTIELTSTFGTSVL